MPLSIDTWQRPSFRRACYLDYVNNFLTVAAFAEYYELTEEQATQLIEEQRTLDRQAAVNKAYDGQ